MYIVHVICLMDTVINTESINWMINVFCNVKLLYPINVYFILDVGFIVLHFVNNYRST